MDPSLWSCYLWSLGPLIYVNICLLQDPLWALDYEPPNPGDSPFAYDSRLLVLSCVMLVSAFVSMI